MVGSVPAGAADHPSELAGLTVEWLPAQVPGTVAGAARAADRAVDNEGLDQLDWWFRCRFAGHPGLQVLELGGIATVSDVWLNGSHLLHSENMFRSHRLPVQLAAGHNELAIRCAALGPVLERRHRRPRWKTYLVPHQNLRWVRTSLLGRIPGWAVVPPAVGPWRPVRLVPADPGVPSQVVLRATCDEEGGGTVSATFELRGYDKTAPSVQLRVGASHAAMTVHPRGPQSTDLVVEGALRLEQVEQWWPHTHGPQPLSEVWADVEGQPHHLGRVGFRTLTVDRREGAFQLQVNGEPVFCRGACWMPIDPVSMFTSDEVLDHRLGLVRAAHMNMLRVPGTTVYQDRRFFERCDELGILVWHDCMFAFMDPPTDDEFTEEVIAEVTEAVATMSGHPCLAVVCGNQEVEEVAAMNGLERDRRSTPLFDDTIAGIVRTALPDVAYVTSNPTGGDPPFRMNDGVSQYFGVGGYLRPLEDARRSGVRFAAECLAFATPPEPETVDDTCGGAYRANHDPSWKQGVHHDAGRSWDMEDVRNHYIANLFGTDPLTERYVDAERALELGRATNAQLMGAVFSEWRRPGSSSGGGLVLSFADLRAGAGWGLVDVLGRPKAPWYVLRRVFQPVTLLLADEGLNGLLIHVLNDTAQVVHGRLAIELVARGQLIVEQAEVAVEVGPRGSTTYNAETILGGFRDICYAYRFSPPAHDAVVATLRSDDDLVLSQVVHLPLGQARPLEADLGLTAVARPAGSGCWDLEVVTARLAQWVTIRAPGWEASDSWFHLPPGGSRSVTLRGEASSAPRGTVQALNSASRAPIRLGDQRACRSSYIRL